MKITTTLVFIILMYISAFGQESKAPKYFLNSKEFNLEKIYLNPVRIDSIRVEKETEDGEVYIFTKEKQISFMPLNDLVKEYTNIKKLDKSTLFKINDKFIYDIDGIEFDKSYFFYVDVIYLSKAQYLNKKNRRLKIVEIDLETKQRKPEIRIRGNLKMNESIDK